MRRRRHHLVILALAVSTGVSAGLAAQTTDRRSTSGDPALVEGYGPWKFGMSRDAVRAVERFGPYSAVRATGGLETYGGEFRGEPTQISFVFGADGLRQIQIWAYTGDDAERARLAFHGALDFLRAELGSLRAEGRPVPADLDPEQLWAWLPDPFRAEGTSVDVDTMEPGDSLQAQVQQFHVRPQEPPEGADIYCSLHYSPQLGLYWVFVHYKVGQSGHPSIPAR